MNLKNHQTLLMSEINRAEPFDFLDRVEQRELLIGMTNECLLLQAK